MQISRVKVEEAQLSTNSRGQRFWCSFEERAEAQGQVKGIQPRNCPFETSDDEMRDTIRACHVSNAL